MKKIKNYILMLAFAIIGVFIVNSKTVFADEEVPDPTEENIVINPNSRGEATYVYETEKPGEEGTTVIEKKQYSKSRDVTFLIKLSQDQLDKYEEDFTVCETIVGSTSTTDRCVTYTMTSEEESFQITSWRCC